MYIAKIIKGLQNLPQAGKRLKDKKQQCAKLKNVVWDYFHVQFYTTFRKYMIELIKSIRKSNAMS